MKVLKRTEEQLILGERGLGTRHRGFFMLLLAGGGLTAITLTGGDIDIGPRIGFIVAASLGLQAAVAEFLSVSVE